jgi:hypothetical protein
MVGKIDRPRFLARKLRFTSLANVCYIARNAVTDCLNDSVEPRADTPLDPVSEDEDASKPKRNAGV